MSRFIVYLFAGVLVLTGCRSGSSHTYVKEESTIDVEWPQFEEDPTSAELENKITPVLNKINSHLEEFERMELTLPGTEYVPDAPVIIWTTEDGNPVRIDQGVANDAGEISAFIEYYFIDGQLFYSFQIFARYLFNEESLLFWVDENWNIIPPDDADYKRRDEYIRQTVSSILELVN